ncbi:lysozyme inhibitor LprI family protein [Pseudomonas sp. NPDC087358]|uniref:lysozyme inhibitor LprI family protein n=1 Tax=Pseudomonas sp. NPDC087358 TaxID=3364439 RepID=UPI00384CB301
MLGRFLFLGLLLVSAAVPAASFDCTKATTFAEKEICRDGYLSGMDKILSDEYKKAMNDAEDKPALKASQLEWIQTRDACTVQKCVDRAMSERIALLRNYPQNEPRAATVVALPAATASTPQPAVRPHSNQIEAAPTTPVAQVPRPSVPPTKPVPTSNSYSKEFTGPSASLPATKAQVKAPGFWDGPLWKYIAIGLLCVTGASMVLHHKGQLSIYTNYTDALITNSLPLAAGAAYGLMAWLELPDALTISVVLGLGIVWVAFSGFTAFVINDSAWKVLISMISKLVLVSLFYVVVAVLIASLVSTKYKDETRAQAAARNKRGNRETVAYLAGFATGYSFMTRWLCRDGRFTSVAECLGIAQLSSDH